MTSWFNSLFWIIIGLHLVGLAALATQTLPPAAARELGAAVLSNGWTLPANCFSW
jgi:hypothetical protein